MQRLPFNATRFSSAEAKPEKEYYILFARIPLEETFPFLLLDEQKANAEKYLHLEDQLSYRYRHHLINTIISTITKKNISEINYQFNAFGKPFITSLPFHFNISHTENSIAICIGPKPMGIDIEMIRNTTLFEPVAVSHYHPNERTFLLANDNDETFLSIWTRKEALLKATGTGLDDELSKYDCTREYETAGALRYSLLTYHCEDTLISLAREQDGAPVNLCVV